MIIFGFEVIMGGFIKIHKLMISTALGLILLACGTEGVKERVQKLGTYWYYYFDTKSESHLQSMTRELLKDVEYKMRYADFIFASYGGKVNPEADKIYNEVGYLDSSIMKRFRYMCAMYRQYTKLEDFMNQKYTMDDMLNGNHLIQGAYHEMLILRDLQNKALDKKEKLERKERAMQFFMEFKMKEKTYSPKSRSKVSRGGALRRVGSVGDGRRNDATKTKKETEKKLKQDFKKNKWIPARSMNESVPWKRRDPKSLEEIDLR